MRLDFDSSKRIEALKIGSSWHHMGTTRMHSDPKRGVVDGNCRVHGVSNLYIAGSSVFPTSGHANPTLTIVALALRLGDHLSRKE
jgi:choline dehydrogenase-like flavoprotein